MATAGTTVDEQDRRDVRIIFAALAMSGMVAAKPDQPASTIADRAVECADELLKALGL